MLRYYLILGSSLLLLGFGALSGYGVREYIGMQRIEGCAASVEAGDLKKCPPPIQRAFKALGQQAEAQGSKDREAIAPVIAGGQRETRANAAAQGRQVAQLNSVEKTSACAASPAFQLRRRQLLADFEAGSDQSQPQADAPAG